MKKNKDLLMGRMVRVPFNLTSDLNNKQGIVGYIVSYDHENDIIQVRFEDNTVGKYQFSALEILYTPKIMMYHLNARISELNQIEVETARRIVLLASVGEYKTAFELTSISSGVMEICVTDVERFYRLKKDIRKHLGIKKGRHF